jgi:hypothetical protein
MTKAMLRNLLLAGTIPAMLGVCAQNMVTGEYWVDTDPGFGAATAFDPDLGGTPNEPVEFDISTAELDPGMHTIGYRTMDATGKWSLTNLRPVYIAAAPSNAPLVRTEYFINSDPGWHSGTNAGVGGAPDVSEGILADLSGARVGMNTLYFRSLDANGRWSLTNHTPLYIADGSPVVVVHAESFWDEDPGFGQGDPVQGLISGADITGQLNVVVPINIGWGNHRLYVRSRDSHGHWSLTNWQMDSINVTGTVDVSDLEREVGISTYPNPFTEGITVRTTDGLPLRVVLYDPQGKLVHDKVLTGETHIDLSGHAQGAYTAFFWKEAKRIHRITLIKQ